MHRLGWGALASAALTFSCGDSGQTGSAECAPVALSCECDSLAGKTLVKATVLAIDVGSVSLEIEQVLNPSPLLDENDEHSQVIGVLAGSLACDRTATPPPQVGDTVLAAFLPYVRRDPNAARDVGEAVVAPWSDAVDVGNGRPLSRSQALTLTDPQTCEQQFPRPAAPPCNDTVGCSLSHVSTQRIHAPWWSLVALLSAAVALARRRARASRVQKLPAG